jgi:hypothetical protein
VPWCSLGRSMFSLSRTMLSWIPAFAGMTKND